MRKILLGHEGRPQKHITVGGVVRDGTRLNGDQVRALLDDGSVIDGDSNYGKALSDPEATQSDVDAAWEKDQKLIPTIAELTSEHGTSDLGDIIQDYYEKYGAWSPDLIRAYMLLANSPPEVLFWDERDIVRLAQWFDMLNGMEGSFSSHLDHDLDVHAVFDKDALLRVTPQDLGILLHAQASITRVSRLMENNLPDLRTALTALIDLSNRLSDYINEVYDESYQGFNDKAQLRIAVQVLSVLFRMFATLAPSFSQTQWSVFELADWNAGKDVMREPWPRAILTPEAEKYLKSLDVKDDTRSKMQVQSEHDHQGDIDDARR